MNGSTDAQLVVFHPYAATLERIISHQIPDLTIHAGTELDMVSEHIRDAAILLAPTRRITNGLLQNAPRLRWIASTSAGNDRLARNPHLPASVILTKGLSHGAVMAEYVLAYLLFFSRKILVLLEKQRQRIWDRSLPRGLSRAAARPDDRCAGFGFDRTRSSQARQRIRYACPRDETESRNRSICR